jgi:peptide deformylase
MSVLPIYLYGAEVLRQKAKPVTQVDAHLIKLVTDMFETMHKASGIGLAATQVGDLNRVIVIDITGVEDDEESEDLMDESVEPNPHRTSPGLPTLLTLINPELVEDDGAWKMEEGCLSIPDVRAEVERPERITVRYRDTSFNVQTLQADGLLARVILHEMDHLDGVLFIDHISKTQRGLLSPKLRKIRKGEVETRYPAVTENDA